MAERKPRPLSEVEIQILDLEEALPNQPESSEPTDGINRLLPPSLEELEALYLPSLEELHLEHAYTSLHSQVVKNRKERKNHFEKHLRRRSYGGSTEEEKQIDCNVMTESEKSRQERRKSFERQQRRRSYHSGTEEAKQREYDTTIVSEIYRQGGNFKKQQRRRSYHGTVGEKQEEMT